MTTYEIQKALTPSFIPLCKEIASLLGGTIEARSEACGIVRLPDCEFYLVLYGNRVEVSLFQISNVPNYSCYGGILRFKDVAPRDQQEIRITAKIEGVPAAKIANRIKSLFLPTARTQWAYIVEKANQQHLAQDSSANGLAKLSQLTGGAVPNYRGEREKLATSFTVTTPEIPGVHSVTVYDGNVTFQVSVNVETAAKILNLIKESSK